MTALKRINEWVSVSEAAEILKATNRRVQQLAADGTLTATRMGTAPKSPFMISRKSVEKYINGPLYRGEKP
jgi:excisionase family DNA binding protein